MKYVVVLLYISVSCRLFSRKSWLPSAQPAARQNFQNYRQHLITEAYSKTSLEYKVSYTTAHLLGLYTSHEVFHSTEEKSNKSCVENLVRAPKKNTAA